ncbi:hypothetical protein BDW62DRAFT_206071 [Aspergillus aurantiobrunneus]
MLGNPEIKALDANLRAVRENSHRHHQDLHQVIGQFRLLLDSYNALRGKYRQEKEGLEKRKQLEEAQDGKRFILVLIDGDAYFFKKRLIAGKQEGGKEAARLLHDSIAGLVRELLGSVRSQCQIMVRIYSNLSALSKTMARAGLVGCEERSLSSFASAFTGAQAFFDFVDTGDMNGGPKLKIQEMLNLFANSNQCRHIFFAGCHDTKYLPMLMPFREKTDRLTLLKAASFHDKFANLELAVRELPDVFMTMPIPTNQDRMASTIPSTPKLCKFYQKGNCGRGDECTNIHTMPYQPFSDSGYNSPSSTSPREKRSPRFTRTESDYATCLPSPTLRPHGFIPVNKDGDRLDTYLPPPPQDEWEEFARQTKKHKLCNDYYLNGGCSDENCEFNHKDLGFDPVNVIKYLLRRMKCKKGTHCRTIGCLFGHHCQKGGCIGAKGCRFDRYGHVLDLAVVGWEMPNNGNCREELRGSHLPRDMSPSDSLKLSLDVSLIDFDSEVR